MNKAIGMLAGAVLLASSGTGNAVTVLATDVGASGTTTINGVVESFSNVVPVPGLTADLFLQYNGTTNGGLTWNFDYGITNTTSGLGFTSRLSSWGLNVTPDLIADGVDATGLFNNTFQNVNLVFLSTVDFCASANASGCSGGAGLDEGQSATGTFSLTFASVLDSISLDEAFVRFQAVSGVVSGFEFDDDSGAGITNGVVINPVIARRYTVARSRMAVWWWAWFTAMFGRRRKKTPRSVWDEAKLHNEGNAQLVG